MGPSSLIYIIIVGLCVSGPWCLSLAITVEPKEAYQEGDRYILDPIPSPLPIVISAFPQDTEGTIGATVIFRVEAIGAPPLAYQWRFEGARMIGATNAELTLNNITALDFGIYTVDVSNDLGSVSAVVHLYPTRTLAIVPAVQLVFQGDSNRWYALQRSTNLSSWETLETVLGGVLFSRFYEVSGQHQYYRMRPTVLAPNVHAPATLEELFAKPVEFRVSLAGEQGSLKFEFAEGGRYLWKSGTNIYSGGLSKANLEGNVMTAILTEDPPATGGTGGRLRIEFTSAMAGTWAFVPIDGVPEIGWYSIATKPPLEGNPPESLAGKKLHVVYQWPFGELFTFTSENAGFYEQGQDSFTYTWNSAESQVRLMRYHVADQLVGTYEIDLMFSPNSSDSGTAEVVFSLPDGGPESDPATFTLQSIEND